MIVAGDVHVDVPLTNVLVGYRNTAMVADQVFPVVSVTKQSDLVPAYDQSHWFRRAAALRAPGTRSRRGNLSNNTDTSYFCKRYSFGVELDDETIANQDTVWDVESRAIQLAADVVMLEREMQLAERIFTTGVWGDDEVAGTDFTAFDNYSLSQPHVVLSGYQNEIEGRIGKEGRSLLIGKDAWIPLRWHPDLIDLIKFVERGLITEQIFMELTGFANIQIGRALYTASPPGTAEASVTYSRVWGKHALVYYQAPNPTILDPSAGYTFTWTRVPNSLQYAVRHRDDQAELNVYEANSYFDQKVVVPRAGTFLQNIVS